MICFRNSFEYIEFQDQNQKYLVEFFNVILNESLDF